MSSAVLTCNRRSAYTLILGIVLSSPIAAEDTNDGPSAAELVKQLGDPSFAQREAASAALKDLGDKAADALEEGAKSLNREIRYRSVRLLSNIRRHQFNALLDRFLNHFDPKESYALPTWSRYRTRIGTSPLARQLFVEMQRAEPDLLRAMDDNLSAATSMLYPRARAAQNMIGRGVQLSLGEVAAIVFVGADPDIQINTTTYSYVSTLLHQSVVREAMKDNAKERPLVASLMGQWILKGEGTIAYQSLVLAMQYQLREGLTVATKTIKEPKLAPHVKQYAIMTIAKLGDKQHIPILESLLADQTMLQRPRINNRTYTTQVRDLAVAGCLHLAGESLKKAGFRADANPKQQMLFNPSMLGFENDQTRAPVFDYWRDVKKKKKLGEQPAEPKGQEQP